MRGSLRLGLSSMLPVWVFLGGCSRAEPPAAKAESELRADFEPLRQALVTAARASFTLTRQRHADEQFSGYALHMDIDDHGVIPAACTVQSVQRVVKRYGLRKEKAPSLGHLRYCPDEWSYVGVESGTDNEWRQAWKMNEALVDNPAVAASDRRRGVIEAMFFALKDLDREGFFGIGAKREAVTIMVWLSESLDADVWQERSIRELNPPAVYKRFLADTKKES